MCKCIENTEKELREKPDVLAKIAPKGGLLKSITAKNMAMMFSSGAFTLNIPYEAEWSLPNERTKTTEIRVIASHCPFCGQPFEK